MTSFEKEYIDEMTEVSKDTDTESAHVHADMILCHILTRLGYTQLIEEYNKIHKWYA
jgi:hypothetical protein